MITDSEDEGDPSNDIIAPTIKTKTPSNDSFHCTPKLWLGIFFILLNNILINTFNYILKLTSLVASELVLFFGPVQVLLALIVILVKRTPFKIPDKSSYAYLVISGFALGVFVPCSLMSVVLMPLGDWVVLVFSSPVFALFLSKLILKQKVNLLKFIFCFTIILGVIFVIQPPILFGVSARSANKLHEYSHYWLAVSLCISAAFATAMNNVVTAKLFQQGVAVELTMTLMGLGLTVLAPLFIYFIPTQSHKVNRIFTDGVLEIPIQDWFTYIGVGAVGTIGTLLVAAANKLAPPVIVSMVRTTQILFVLVLDIVLLNIYPNVMSSTGSVLVIISVIGMSTSDQLMRKWKQFRRRNNENVPLEQEEMEEYAK